MQIPQQLPPLPDLSLVLLLFTGNGPSLSSHELNQLSTRKNELPMRICQLTKQLGRKVFRQLEPRTNTTWYEFHFNSKMNIKLALIAGLVDDYVSRVKPMLVPKEMSEIEFFSNYFSYILALRRDIVQEEHYSRINTTTMNNFINGNISPLSSKKNVITTNNDETIHVFEFRSFISPSNSTVSSSSNTLFETETTIVNLPPSIQKQQQQQPQFLSSIQRKYTPPPTKIKTIDTIQVVDCLMTCLEFHGPLRFLDHLCPDRSMWCHALNGDEWLNLFQNVISLEIDNTSTSNKDSSTDEMDKFIEFPSNLVLSKLQNKDLEELLTTFHYRVDRDEKASQELMIASSYIRESFNHLVPLYCTETEFWTNTLVRIGIIITNSTLSYFALLRN
jgi:hypothetical protein